MKPAPLSAVPIVMRIVRIIGAVVAGYAVMVLLLLLVQDVSFGGVSWEGSSLPVLAVAGFGSFLAALAGGLTAAWIAGAGGRLAAGVMSALVAFETTALTVTGQAAGPLWFDVLAAGTLVVGILLGVELFARCCRRRGSPSVA